MRFLDCCVSTDTLILGRMLTDEVHGDKKQELLMWFPNTSESVRVVCTAMPAPALEF